MIELIYGAKGSGKTQAIIEKANKAAETSNGNVVFITPVDKYSLDIKNAIRFVVTGQYDIKKGCALEAFIKGMIAGNADIKEFYIDGIARIGEIDVVPFIHKLDALSEKYKVHFTVTLSMAEVPAELKRYL